jgi:hypothetical protein
MGSGVAFIDYDGDGFQDIFLHQQSSLNEVEIRAYQNGSWTQNEIEVFRGFAPVMLRLARSEEGFLAGDHRDESQARFTTMTETALLPT